jgi:hypothetical protein
MPTDSGNVRRYRGESGRRGGHPVSVAIAQIAARAAEYGKDDAIALANCASGDL